MLRPNEPVDLCMVKRLIKKAFFEMSMFVVDFTKYFFFYHFIANFMKLGPFCTASSEPKSVEPRKMWYFNPDSHQRINKYKKRSRKMLYEKQRSDRKISVSWLCMRHNEWFLRARRQHPKRPFALLATVALKRDGTKRKTKNTQARLAAWQQGGK